MKNEGGRMKDEAAGCDRAGAATFDFDRLASRCQAIWKGRLNHRDTETQGRKTREKKVDEKSIVCND
jgi:hypothetical protein